MRLIALMLVAPDGLGLPELEQQDEGTHGNDGADDVHQPGSVVVAHQELRDREAATGHEAGRPDFHHGFASGHGPDDPEGDDQGENGQDAASGGAEAFKGKSSHSGQGDDGRAQGAIGHGCRVADEGQAGGLEGTESKADQHGRGDRHGRAETGGALDKGAEAEGDEQRLDAAISCQTRNGMFHHLEITRLHRDVVDEDGVQHDPADGS